MNNLIAQLRWVLGPLGWREATRGSQGRGLVWILGPLVAFGVLPWGFVLPRGRGVVVPGPEVMREEQGENRPDNEQT